LIAPESTASVSRVTFNTLCQPLASKVVVKPTPSRVVSFSRRVCSRLSSSSASGSGSDSNFTSSSDSSSDSEPSPSIASASSYGNPGRYDGQMAVLYVFAITSLMEAIPGLAAWPSIWIWRSCPVLVVIADCHETWVFSWYTICLGKGAFDLDLDRESGSLR